MKNLWFLTFIGIAIVIMVWLFIWERQNKAQKQDFFQRRPSPNPGSNLGQPKPNQERLNIKGAQNPAKNSPPAKPPAFKS
jgi:hypothetical protein